MIRRIILQTTVLALMKASLAFSQASWQKYQGNPVLTATQSWESGFGVIGPRVLKIGNIYKMWYTGLGSRFQIGLATSNDGINWTKSNSNPVLPIGQPGNFDADHVDYPSVIFHNNKYWMWYTGWSSGVRQIGLATSTDGVNWTKHSGNPVLTVGPTSAWDAQGAAVPCVIYDGKFKMWYHGKGLYPQAVGYAESIDGINWQKHSGNPVLTPLPNSWESSVIGINSVIKVNGIYQMWYGGNDGNTTRYGYAISGDGVHWERFGSNPIFSPGPSSAWDSGPLGGFFVLRESAAYKMWYAGNNGGPWSIGYAASSISTGAVAKRFIYIPKIYGLPGDTITVTVFADTVSTISGGDVTIKFDAEILKAVKLQSTKYTRDFLMVANLDTPGVAHVSLASARGAVGGTGGLFNIKMAVNPALPVPPAPQPRPLKLAQVSFYTENGKAIPLTKRDGEFILGRTRGDVNRDGRVNSADAILALRIASGLLIPTPAQLADADMDGNNRVESIDASCMLYQAVGLDCPPGGVSNMAANLFIAPFSIRAGEEIETKISVHGIDKLLSGDVSLRFDSNTLEIVEIQPSTEMRNVAFVSNLTSSAQVSFSFAVANGIQTQTMAIIRLRAKSQITEKSLRSNNATLFDGQGKRWTGVLTGVDETQTAELPAQFRLEQNYPNPFHLQGNTNLNATAIATQTQIPYALPQNSHVTLAVYDINGRLVRLLEDAEKAAGAYVQVWDGKNQFQTPAVPGFYFYHLRAGQMTLTRKLLLLP